MPISEQQRLGIEASNAAKKRLIENNAAEFEQLHSEERVKLGLTPEKAKKGRTLEEKIERAQERLNELVAQRDAAA